jgi:hypothetical protein
MNGTAFFQAAEFTAVQNERLAIVLGVVVLVLGLAVFFSCRAWVSWLRRLGVPSPTRVRGYALFYRYHLYYWWAFGVLLVAHLLVAVLHTGLPQSSDPDAGVHWRILGLGLFSGISAAVSFSSCRVLPRLAAMATPRSPLNNIAYRIFFNYHSYYWLIVGVLVALHFVFAYRHAGIWPGLP